MASDAENFSISQSINKTVHIIASIKQIQCKHKVTDAKYKKLIVYNKKVQ